MKNKRERRNTRVARESEHTRVFCSLVILSPKIETTETQSISSSGAELTEHVKPNCVHCLVGHRIRSIHLIGKSCPNGKLTKKPWLSALNTPKRAKDPDGSKSSRNMYVFFLFFSKGVNDLHAPFYLLLSLVVKLRSACIHSG